MNNPLDPRNILNESKMTWLQLVVVALTVVLNALDGFDVLVIAVSANGIATEWGIDRAGLGFVLTAELAGMALGSLFFGGIADKKGRRFTLLLCLSIMASGMFLATTANGPIMLCLWRVFTGLGIGGMLSSTNAVVAEFSNRKRRALCISLMVIGYPLGGTLVGIFASNILIDGSWRTLFFIGGAIATIMIPVVYFLVPESVHWLTRTQPTNALERVNYSLKKLGHKVVSSLPVINEETLKTSILDIFSPKLIKITFIILAAYSFHMVTFYFLLKWTPTIVTDFGFNAALASGVMIWANLGAALGGLTFGLLTARIGLKPLTVGILFCSALAVVGFGYSPADLFTLKILAAFAGFFSNAAISGLYSIVAIAFPTHVRATGTGFVIGIGRGGAVLSPIIAGYLFQAEVGLQTVSIIMATGSIIAVIVLAFLKLEDV